MPTNGQRNREAWLTAAAYKLRPFFTDAGFPITDRVCMSIGFTSQGRRGSAAGECWDARASADGHDEIFIRPDQADDLEILSILTHELVHVAVGTEAKHGPLFRKCAHAIGLEGKMRSTTASPALVDRFKWIIEMIGPIPHAALDFSAQRKKQTTRLIKVECPTCGYTARTTRTWIDKVGTPLCPAHGAMACDGYNDDPFLDGLDPKIFLDRWSVVKAD